jgi:catechol 2,3-dioxygenase-like lactoylglutathione lyase family enzyme
MEFKLELVLIPVTDVDRAKAFYTEQAGFHLEVDTPVGPDMRVVQVTPPGSACSVGFGVGITAAPPRAPGHRDRLTRRGAPAPAVSGPAA